MPLHSFGTIFQTSSTGAGYAGLSGGYTWVTLSEVKDIEVPGIKTTITEVNNLTVASAFKQKLAGLLDGDKITLTLQRNATNFSTLATYQTARGALAVQIVFTTGEAFRAAVYVSMLGKKVPEDAAIEFPVEFTITGAPTFA